MLTKKEVLLIANLREDGRQSITSLSRKTKIPISTVYAKLKGYEKAIIKKYTPIIDFTSLGYAARTAIMLKVAAKDKPQVKEFLQRHKAVNTCYRVNNNYDFFIEAIFKSLNEVQAFIDVIEDQFTVQSKEMHYVLDEYKKEDFLAEPTYVKLTEWA